MILSDFVFYIRIDSTYSKSLCKQKHKSRKKREKIKN